VISQKDHDCTKSLAGPFGGLLENCQGKNVISPGDDFRKKIIPAESRTPKKKAETTQKGIESDVKKSVRFLEKRGGGLPPQPPAKPTPTTTSKTHGHVTVVSYTDTPMKKTYRQLEENWQPIWKGQESPDFRLMRQLVRDHDTSTFEAPKRLVAMPEHKPTGKGLMHDERETGHFVRETLRKINPILATAYVGTPAITDHLERHQTFTDFEYGRRGRGSGVRPRVIGRNHMTNRHMRG